MSHLFCSRNICFDNEDDKCPATQILDGADNGGQTIESNVIDAHAKSIKIIGEGWQSRTHRQHRSCAANLPTKSTLESWLHLDCQGAHAIVCDDPDDIYGERYGATLIKARGNR